MLDKLKSCLGPILLLSCPFWFSCVGLFGGWGMILGCKKVFRDFGSFLVGTRPRECQKRIPREKLCRVRKFSAQTAVWEAISWPKRVSCVGRRCFAILVWFLVGTRPRHHHHETRLVLEMFCAGVSSKLQIGTPFCGQNVFFFNLSSAWS